MDADQSQIERYFESLSFTHVLKPASTSTLLKQLSLELFVISFVWQGEGGSCLRFNEWCPSNVRLCPRGNPSLGVFQQLMQADVKSG